MPFFFHFEYTATNSPDRVEVIPVTEVVRLGIYLRTYLIEGLIAWEYIIPENVPISRVSLWGTTETDVLLSPVWTT